MDLKYIFGICWLNERKSFKNLANMTQLLLMSRNYYRLKTFLITFVLNFFPILLYILFIWHCTTLL